MYSSQSTPSGTRMSIQSATLILHAAMPGFAEAENVAIKAVLRLAVLHDETGVDDAFGDPSGGKVLAEIAPSR